MKVRRMPPEVVMAGVQGEQGVHAAVLENEGALSGHDQGDISQYVVNPAKRNLRAATGAQTSDLTRMPGGGQSRQEGEDGLAGSLLMALQEHLGDGGCAAEVPVDLEGRVGAEEICVGTARFAGVLVGGGVKELL